MRFNTKPEVTEKDLIRPLSYEALEYYAGVELGDDWDTKSGMKRGKFVLLGAQLFLGSTIEYGKPKNGKYKWLRHFEIRNFALDAMSPTEVETLKGYAESIESRKIDNHVMLDAGFYSIGINADTIPMTLELSGNSKEFGCANPEGRRLTGELASDAIGQSVEVYTKP